MSKRCCQSTPGRCRSCMPSTVTDRWRPCRRGKSQRGNLSSSPSRGRSGRSPRRSSGRKSRRTRRASKRTSRRRTSRTWSTWTLVGRSPPRTPRSSMSLTPPARRDRSPRGNSSREREHSTPSTYRHYTESKQQKMWHRPHWSRNRIGSSSMQTPLSPPGTDQFHSLRNSKTRQT